MTKISIIGAGFVGSTCAYALLLQGIANEIAIVDVNKEKAHGEALDLENGISFTKFAKVISSDDYAITQGSNIVVITAGFNQKPGETRLQLIGRNAIIMEQICEKLMQYTPDSIFLIVSNPVDVLTSVAMRCLGLSSGRVFGSGTTLDTARLRHFASEIFHVNQLNVHAYVLGEHGDNSFVAWSNASISNIPVSDFEQATPQVLTEIEEKVQNCAYEIIKKKGATHFAIGAGVAYICSAIRSDKKMVMPVSTIPLPYGITDVCLGVPCVVGKKGVERVLHLRLDDAEKKKLEHAASVLRTTLHDYKN